ncbi:hypothetical protein E3J48_08225 [Candidatus Aerophobetes bacterium]|uniref:Uncharacterized protein n=1 Tax=Aerophobetes bacterium TaxID=2030807 RepID=A0A523VWF4_UNCAE|nr:MAG: hypothetical protein E3J48_08225 [Candidatus Aerophobetes bacterium]
MRARGLLVAFLLGVCLCFVPDPGHGEIRTALRREQASSMDVELLKAQVRYMMYNPAAYLSVNFHYMPAHVGDVGDVGDVVAIEVPSTLRALPGNIIPLNKIYVLIRDTRGVFSSRTGVDLLDQFKRTLENIYSYVDDLATDMDSDIVAEFYSQEGIILGYFSQGEYHLWER